MTGALYETRRRPHDDPMTQTSTPFDTPTESRTDTALLELPAAEPTTGARVDGTPGPGDTDGRPEIARPAVDAPGPPPEPSAPETVDRSTTAPEPDLGTHDSSYAHILAEMDDDRRNLRWALAVAVLFHVGLFFVHLPDLMRPVEVGPAAKRRAYLVQQVRFQPPRTAPQREIPEKKARKIPIPDPTPDDPEPVRELAEELPDLDYDLPVGDLNLGIPQGPPGPSLGPILQVGGEVERPIPLYAPRPGYTEEARQARIQGVVLLQLVIDREGNVRSAKIIKGLPMGLDQKAVETVKEWKYQPALQNGNPVSVYMNLTINFSLQ
jgi:TonB family protein